jgi:hypothetical protein
MRRKATPPASGFQRVSPAPRLFDDYVRNLMKVLAELIGIEPTTS